MAPNDGIDDNGKSTNPKQEDPDKGLVVSRSAISKRKSKAAKSALRDVARRSIDPVSPVPTGRRFTRLSSKYPIATENYAANSEFDVSEPNRAPPGTSKRPTKKAAVRAAATPVRKLSKDRKGDNGKSTRSKQEDPAKGVVVSLSAISKRNSKSAKTGRDVPVGQVPTGRGSTHLTTTYPIRRVGSARAAAHEVPSTSKQLPKKAAARAAATSARQRTSARLQKTLQEKKSPVSDQMAIMNDEVSQPAAPNVAPQNSKSYKNDDKLVVVLSEHEELFIYGTMELQLLYGKISVFGHTITNTERTYKMYVPHGTSQFSIKNICRYIMDVETRDALRSGGLGMHQLTKIRGGESVISCRDISNDALHNAFRMYFPRDLYPGMPRDMWCQLRDKTELSRDTEQRFVVEVPRNWDAIAVRIVESSRLFFAGDRGTGKSTMLRYFVNYLLNRFPAVKVIDLDPCQSEFTVNGCISATVVTEPLFGPSYTHLKTPELCIPVRTLNGQSDEGYVQKACFLVTRSDEDLEQAPTLINFTGHTGLNAIKLIACAIAVTRPTLVIQLTQTVGGKNYECPLNAANVESILNKRRMGLPWDYDYKVRVLKTAVTCQPAKAPGFQMTIKENRDLGVIAYFSQLFSANVPYLLHPDIKAIRVPYDTVTLLWHDRVTTPDVVNGELIMLCTKIDVGSPTFRCHGWGIVKMVNVEKKILYIITPVHPEVLNSRHVEYLMMGTSQMPLTFYTKCKGYVEELPIPYVDRVDPVALNLPLVLYDDVESFVNVHYC